MNIVLLVKNLEQIEESEENKGGCVLVVDVLAAGVGITENQIKFGVVKGVAFDVKSVEA
ncbi:MAG: hypothetical protein HOA09_05305 [Nitrospina sp.]|jgi:hypothetical protein|nr:hypothetical protein [Nitrospina sp.]